jgi:hypothetical protein
MTELNNILSVCPQTSPTLIPWKDKTNSFGASNASAVLPLQVVLIEKAGQLTSVMSCLIS